MNTNGHEWTRGCKEEFYIDQRTFAQSIDHTLLKAGATRDDIRNLCREAREFGFGAVCINPCFVTLAARELRDNSRIRVCTVVGFPLGANTIETKVAEARQAALDGADELDLVLNIGALKEGDKEYLTTETTTIVRAAREVRRSLVVKVIAETSLLAEDEKRLACRVVTGSGADYFKNATGYGPGGADADEIRFLRKLVGPQFRIKAAGGIRDLETALSLLEAGADRLGTSSGVAVMREWINR